MITKVRSIFGLEFYRFAALQKSLLSGMLGFGALFEVSCSQDFSAVSNSKEELPEVQNFEPATAQVNSDSAVEYIDPLLDKRNNFGGEVSAKPTELAKVQVIDVQQRRSTVGVTEPIKFIFLVDSSYTMAATIGKLSEALDGFYARLASSKIPHDTRLLTFDNLTTQLSEQQGYYFPAGLFGRATGAGVPKSAELVSQYSQAIRFRGTDDFIAPLQSLRASINDPNRVFAAGACVNNRGLCLNNEPGICLAMDYLSWLESGSVEANSLKFGASDSVHIVSLSDEDNKREVGLINGATNEVIPGSTKPLLCALGSGSNCGKKYDELRRWTEYVYEKPYSEYQLRYKDVFCDSEAIPLVDFQGTFECSKVVNYTCDVTVPKTNYLCKAGNGPTLTQDAPRNDMRCESADAFLCDVYLDNNALQRDVPFNRSNALQHMANGGSCRVDTSKTYSFRDFQAANATDPAYATKYGLKNCQAYVCQANPFTVTERRTLDSDNGNNCVPNRDKKAYYDLRNKSVAFGCPSGYSKVTASQVLNFDRNWCLNTLNPSTFDSSFNTIDAVKDGLKIVNGGPNSAIMVKTVADDSGTLSKAQAQAKVSPALNAPDYYLNEDPEVTQRLSTLRSLTARPDLLSQGYTERKVTLPAPCAAASSDCVKYQGKDYLVRGASAVEPPVPDSDPAYSANVEVVQKFDPNGRFTSTEACQAGIENQYLKPTPENFRAFVERNFPQAKLTWHTIGVTQGNTNCKGETGDYLAKDYINISRTSPGSIVQNICAPNFTDFFEQLALKLETEVLTSYSLADTSAAGYVLEGVKSAAGVELVEGRDYAILPSGQIKFMGKVAQELRAGDQFTVRYRVAAP